MLCPRMRISFMKHSFMLVLLLLQLLGVRGFVNSPKIVTKDGNLIFESGLNRNISFRLSGKSRININDEFDLLDLLQGKKGPHGSTGMDQVVDPLNSLSLRELYADLSSMKLRAFGPQGLDKRIRRLQNRTRNANQLLRRYRTRLQDIELKMSTLYERLETDNCKSNPCENGGTCFNMFNSFMCKCTDNFEGATCEKDVNECALFTGTDAGCQNGAQCVNQFGGYNCICSPGWFGIHCSQHQGDCMQSSTWELCGHGTCVNAHDNNFGYKCICDQGWKTNGMTPSCQVDVNECTESHPPCATRCINLAGSFTCAPCPAGLTGNGISCYDIDECALDNGGCSINPRVHCINSYGSFHCGECPLGWMGNGRTCVRAGGNTENDIITGAAGDCAGGNICHPDAKCTEVSNTVVCSCPIGMVGNGIGANGCVHGTSLNCNSMPCLNGGTCVDSGSSYICLCPHGFRAPNCTSVRNPCMPNPCHNNGRCRQRDGIDFQCQCSPGYSGRLCDNRFSRCGGMLVGTVGRLKYPENSLYEHNAQCAWVIRTNETQVLNVTFNAFELEDSRECRFDWLQVNDGRSAAAQVLGRFCGTHKPLGGNIISSTNYLYLWFRSDNSTSKEGFDLEWSTIEPQCGGLLEVESHGTIATPGSPGNYPKNRDCHWQLRAPNDKRLKLTFFNLQIENHDSCNYDYVEIRDSVSNMVLEKFCNSSRPAPVLLPTSEASIHFHSDNEGTDSGFQIYYSTEERIPGCGGTFTANEGTIKSPVAIEDSISCEYDIKMSGSESIKVEFLKFELGDQDCIEFYDIDTARQINALQSKFCGSYGITPTPLNSLYSTLRIKYYSKGGQFELKYKAGCSYTFESDEDVILSPGYPGIGNTERFCAYKILTAPNKIISMHVVDFELKDSSLEDNDCAYTFLKITDALGRDLHGPFCGNNTPSADMVFKSNMITLNFQSVTTSSGRGFKIEYKTRPIGETDCGGVYTKPGSSIRLPSGDDGLYYHNMECYWIILAPVNKHIMLNWKSLKLEETTDCVYDYIEIYDNLAIGETSKPLGRYCNAHPPPSILSHSRTIIIKFVSDSSDANDGFEASYDFVDNANLCGGEIMSSVGRISTPDWPGNYSNGLDCNWTITGPQGTQIELLIDMFELESSEKCANDWLEVRNGGSPQSSLVGYYCGISIPQRLPSFANQMRLHFHSDGFVNARGFVIRWQVFSNGCGGNLQGEMGVITSPLYPNPYPHGAQCEWRIIVHKGSSIHLTIEDLEMEDLFRCSYDNLKIFDGRTSMLPLVELCRLDEDKPRKFVTKTNEAVIRFITDESNNDRGFLMSYYANCTITLTAIYGVIESPNFGDSFYRNDINCSWTIKAPKGNRIVMEFSFFDKLDDSGELYLLDGTKNGTVTHVIRDRDSFNSTGETLTIVQNSTVVSFRLEYSMIGCIGILHRNEGEFHSPNYPQMYPNDIECLWEIKTALGQSVEVTIENMDIEESVNCTKDALIVSNSGESKNIKERHCGKQDSLILTGISGHHLYVRFTADIQNNGKGFKATYRTTKLACGGTIAGRNGVIHSPNYPLNYPPNTVCEWTIDVTALHTITFILEELDMEDYYDCEMDYLEVSEYTPNEDNEVKLFRKCGNLEVDSEVEWTTTSSNAIVRFKSDESNEYKGFKLSFKENCGERIIVEPHYEVFLSRTAQGNETCEWQLIAEDPSQHITFSPTHVQLSPILATSHLKEGDCIDKGVKIYDGPDDKAPLRSKFCMAHPPTITSNGNALTIKVPFGVISEFEGVYSTIESFCSGVYDSIQGKFSSPQYPSSYPLNIDCEWFILASKGNSLVLTFESMALEISDECNRDYIEVRENNERGRLLGLFCGNTVPPPILGTQTLWVRFNSDNDNVAEGFLASYNYAMHNEINGTNGTIESPRYPTKFHSNEPYSWRITVDKDYAVVLTMQHIVDTDMPYIKFYDGYSDIGMQIDYKNTHIVRSNTNILYLTASRGPFQFVWEQLSKEALRSNRTAEDMATACGNKLIAIDGPTLSFKSPGYPSGYAPNLHCKWNIIASNPAQHVSLNFVQVDLEEFGGCLADYVTVSASNDLQNWRELDSLCKKDPAFTKRYQGTPYLQLEFVTDSGVNRTGFSSLLRTECGSELTDRRGFVNITNLGTGIQFPQIECIWTIRVRQGRRVRIKFLDSYLQNGNETGNCRTYFVLRNGIAEDSPFLGKGKYCENDITDVLETSSNRAFVKFSRLGFPRFRASFHYEEITHECSDEIDLSDETAEDHMKTITSPNYPNIPNPHSECIWKITAPQHHIIAIDFVGSFNVGDGDTPCEREYVQLNDGATELMPMLGKYCGTVKPDSMYTSANVLRIKYFTDISEPHTGFKANVSIGRCGGTYFTSEGVINSPINLNSLSGVRELECVYTIELQQGSTINLTIDQMDLPLASNCSLVSHLELQEVDPYGDDEVVTDILRLCGNEERRFIVETNKIVISYKIKGTPSANNFFRLSYSAIGHRCGETIVASGGILQTPGYPGGVSRPTHCTWRLRVPKGKRIKIEFLDFDTGNAQNSSTPISFASTFRGRLSFANDFLMQSIIARISDNPPDSLYSTDNKMMIDAFLLAFSRHRGFKLRFSSNEDSLVCAPYIDLSAGGTIQLKAINNTAVYCSYFLNVPSDETLVLYVDKYETHMNYIRLICALISPLRIQLAGEPLLPHLLCENVTQPNVRLPFPVTLELSANKRNMVDELGLRFKMYKCGGLKPLSFGEAVNISQPQMAGNYSGVLECAWLLAYSQFEIQSYNLFEFTGKQLEMTLTTDFKGKCEEQYLLLYNGPNQNSPQLGRYCGQASADNLVVERGLFFEYYTSSYEKASTFNLSVKIGSGCGGTLNYPYREIVFNDQYKNNVECIWEIITDPGFHLGLTFENRFFIEASKNCTKDYLKLQQRNLQDNDWVDLQTICGRTVPDAINTTTTKMRLIFRSDGDTIADGFTAKFERNCGGILYATETVQQLSSPGYPQQYENNLYCNYTILPKDENGGGVLVQFVDFEVEEPPLNICIFDNVTIYTQDKFDNVMEKVLCGRNRNYAFRAQERITIVIRTDQSFGNKGFLLNYSDNVCGGSVTNSSIIHSPHDHSSRNFPHNSNCFWNLTAPEGFKILIKFEELDFESHSQCTYDSVEVYKGLSANNDQRLAKLCGNLTGKVPMLSIPSNTALLHSFSDERDASKGFKALVSFVPNCDTTIFLGVGNNTYLFNTYAGGYANNLDCTYVFTTTPDRQLLVDFSSFHVENSSNCQDDYLDIRDGAGPFADQIGQFCGHITPSRLMSSRQSLFMRFVSDSDKTSSGFSAMITGAPLACGQHLLEINGNQKIVLKSPDDGHGNYLKNLNCFWKIRSDNNIHLKFEKLDIEGPNADGLCVNDYLKIYNAKDASFVEQGYGSNLIFNGQHVSDTGSDFATQHIYCGNGTPDEYYASNQVYVKFKTDENGSKSGFSLTAMVASGCFRNFTGTQGRILVAETKDHCDIYIKSPQNYTLSLYYADVAFSEYDCTTEYIEVFDAHTNTSLQKICSYLEPGKSLFTSTNELRMRIKMSTYYTQFDMTYLASQNGPGCGGDLYNTAGLITNPFYPNNIRSYSNCRWNIRVPSNLHVLLKFDVFNLGAKTTCHSDYLQIIEKGTDGEEHVVRQYCGEDNPEIYKSESSQLSVLFHKTVNYDGTGWVLRFTGVFENYQIPDYYLNQFTWGEN